MVSLSIIFIKYFLNKIIAILSNWILTQTDTWTFLAILEQWGTRRAKWCLFISAIAEITKKASVSASFKWASSNSSPKKMSKKNTFCHNNCTTNSGVTVQHSTLHRETYRGKLIKSAGSEYMFPFANFSLDTEHLMN